VQGTRGEKKGTIRCEIGNVEVQWNNIKKCASEKIMISKTTGGFGLTGAARCTCEIKSRITIATAAFNRMKTLFARKLDLNLRKKLIKCYIWSMALYGTKTWTHLKVDEKYRISSEIWCWRRMKKISWADCVRSEEQLQ